MALPPPPGLYVAYLPYIYLVHSIKGASGNTVVDQVTTNKKLLGADDGISVIFPIVNMRFEAT
jgi:hypothetical protein